MIETFRCYIDKEDQIPREKGTDREVLIRFLDGDEADYNRFLNFLAGCSQFGERFYDPKPGHWYIEIVGLVEEKDRETVTIRFNISTSWTLVSEERIIKRVNPGAQYLKMPCSFVAVGCAYEDYYKDRPVPPMPDGLREDGYLPTAAANRYIRTYLPVEKRVHYNRGSRPAVKDILSENEKHCIIYAYGHFIYANKDTYWSFLENAEDDVADIWYLEDMV